MTAEPDLLPLPGLPNIGAGGQWSGWSDDDMRAYARACVSSATAAKDAEIEALRAEVERLQGYVHEADRRVGEQFMAAQDANAHRLRALHDRLLDVKRAEAAEARAERLAEALRHVKQKLDDVVMIRGCHGAFAGTYMIVTEALHPIAAQEAGRE